MKKIAALIATSAALLGIAAAPASAADEFGLTEFDGIVANQDGTVSTQAGAHPYKIITVTNFAKKETKYGPMPAVSPKNVHVSLPAGFAGNPTVVPQCSEYDLARDAASVCPVNTQIGNVRLKLNFLGNESEQEYGLYNMVVPPGTPSNFGFNVLGVPVHLTASLRSGTDYGIDINLTNINQTLTVYASEVEVWGVPASPAHDAERCFGQEGCGLPGAVPVRPLLTNSTNCSAGPTTTSVRADGWLRPGVFDFKSFVSHDNATPPNPVGNDGCDAVPFTPAVEAAPTSDRAEAPTGLNYELAIPSGGIMNPEGLAQANVKKATVTLPAGMGINPSAGEGLGVCSEAEFNSETATSPQGAGCPNASKVGTVRIKTPLLEEEANGAVYIAKQYDNPFDSLLALYIVAKVPERGILVKVPGKVTPDPQTGQLVTTFDNLPQLPFSEFQLNFREGQRSPLSSPPTCGTYAVRSELVPWSASDPDNPLPSEIQTRVSEFKVTKGYDGNECPSTSSRPFRPNLTAGTINNAAGRYSPFNIRLTRNDGEQEFTNFSIKLPPGISGKLAGVPFCPDAAIAAAKSRTGSEELASPSCPQASEVGRTLVGAGVGSVLTYAPGKIYLAGPYHGSALSVAAITAAKVGPFDLGTVVIRQALKVNPETAEVFVDAVGSDPIPHIIQGIPVHARDIRIYMDRPEFVLNPTSCERTSTASTLLGSGLDFASDSDNQPITITSPFQAADCANLGFKPRLKLNLIGGTKRGDNPKFRAELTTRKGDANIGRAQVTLPHSQFLDNEHIKTICTRAQYAQGSVPGEKCPKASIYGYARAITPILDEPLQGPVFLRSSSHQLPDLVAALHSGKININLDGRIDSVENGRIRNTFEEIPDAPVSKFILTMQGGKKGLLINSRNLCKAPARAKVSFTGQNGKVSNSSPQMKVKCGKKSKTKTQKKNR